MTKQSEELARLRERERELAILIVQLLSIIKFGHRGWADDIHVTHARHVIDQFPDEVRDHGESLYRAWCAADPDHKEEGTREGLAIVASMLETYGPDTLPANEHGQVHFARAMIDSAAREIRAFLAASPEVIA